jgi:acetamidase/formamidase
LPDERLREDEVPTDKAGAMPTQSVSRDIQPVAAVLQDTFSRDHEPVVRCSPGEVLVVRTLNCSGHLTRMVVPGELPTSALPNLRGHCLVGPIAVEGAQVGQLLAVRLVSLRPADWGFTAAGGRDTPLNHRLDVADVEPAWLVWDLDADAGVGVNQHGLAVSLTPFLGVIGVAPPEPGEHSTIPPRTVGAGNIDCKELVAGSTLFIPIAVDGALLYLGDGHAAQGDGEVGGTAIETGMTTELILDLVDDAPLATVHAVTPTSRITFGFDADLNEASAAALDAMLAWMQQLYGVDKPTALGMASVAVDLRVTQIANQTWGVHAVLDNDTVAAA